MNKKWQMYGKIAAKFINFFFLFLFKWNERRQSSDLISSLNNLVYLNLELPTNKNLIYEFK